MITLTTINGVLPLLVIPNLDRLRIKKMPKEKDYKFVDSKIEYMISDTGEIFIQVDPEKDLWAEIHAKDIEFMKSHKGKANGS